MLRQEAGHLTNERREKELRVERYLKEHGLEGLLLTRVP